MRAAITLKRLGIGIPQSTQGKKQVLTALNILDKEGLMLDTAERTGSGMTIVQVLSKKDDPTSIIGKQGMLKGLVAFDKNPIKALKEVLTKVSGSTVVVLDDTKPQEIEMPKFKIDKIV